MIQESSLGLLHCRWILDQLGYLRAHYIAVFLSSLVYSPAVPDLLRVSPIVLFISDVMGLHPYKYLLPFSIFHVSTLITWNTVTVFQYHSLLIQTSVSALVWFWSIDLSHFGSCFPDSLHP